jgi:hypothetical protein
MPIIRKQGRPKWVQVKSGQSTLLQELTRLYWAGVEQDLGHFLEVLQTWQQDKYQEQQPFQPDGDNYDNWLGFESFVKRATGSDLKEMSVRTGYLRLDGIC